MRIFVLLVALALVSVANQKAVGFGEFVEGHNGAVKKFRVIKASKANAYVQSNQVFVTVKSGNALELEDPCGICRNFSGRAPICVKRACKSTSDHEAIKNILFGRRDAAKIINNINSSGPFPYKSINAILYLKRQ